MNKKRELIFRVVLTAAAAGFFSGQCSHIKPKNPEARPWQNREQKVHFMLALTSNLVAPMEDECISRLNRELSGTRSASFAPPPDFLLAQSIASDGHRDDCSKALTSCGSCHLPRKNNCNYRVHYRRSGEKISFRGKVESEESGVIVLKNDSGDSVRLDKSEVEKTEWLDGGEDPVRWWNFKERGKKGELVKKMLAIAAENDVACTNCHKQHGDFRLTPEGETFRDSGRVIRKVPLSAFTGR